MTDLSDLADVAGPLGLVDELDAQVRAVVRRDGVDPQREVRRVRGIAEDVVRAHDERSLTGVVEPVPDASAAVAELVARVSGFGALQPYLDDPEVEEIWVNHPSRVFVARSGRHELTTTMLTRAEVRELVERMLKQSGRRLDLSSPFVDARLPQGHRLHVVLEGISSDFDAVNIRKFVVRASRLVELVELDSLTTQAARFLEMAVLAGLNVVVAGGTQAGKTTMLNCLAAAIPGGDRIVSAEEVRELQVSHPDWVALETRQAGLEGTGEVTLRDLVRESLRMRPTRLIVGEVRAAECLDLLLALNSGLPGMATLHANSAREALVKLCTLPMLAGENISARFVVPTVAASVDLVVHLGLGADGVRRVNEIVAVPGRVEHEVIEAEPIFVREGERLVRPGGMPQPARRRSRVPASTSSGCCAGEGLMGAVPRSRRGARPGADRFRLRLVPRRARPGGHRGSRDAAGARRSARGRPGGAGGALRLLRAAAFLAVLVLSRTPPVAVVFAVIGATVAVRGTARAGAPATARARRGVARGGRQPRLRHPRRARPAGSARRACGPRPGAAAGAVRGVRPGLPGHRPVRRGPRPAQGPARRSGRGPGGRGAPGRAGGRGRRPRPTAAQPVALPAGGPRTRAELESRQAWTVNGARLAVAAPWLVLLLAVVPAAR